MDSKFNQILLGASFSDSDWDFAFSPGLFLSSKVIRLTVLGKDKEFISNASGFIIREDNGYYLYTCWHVVTGIDFFDPKTPRNPPNRSFLRITGKDAREIRDGIEVGGETSVQVPLYSQDNRPAWILDNGPRRPNEDLASIGIEIPESFDVIRLRINLPHHLAQLWSFNSDRDIYYGYSFNPGTFSTVILAGYPYGYSPNPLSVNPVFLKRMIACASTNILSDTLLDGGGMPGMSGGPVFSEKHKLVGIYRGIIFPDAQSSEKSRKGNDRFAALGIMTDVALFQASFKD